MLVTQKKIKTDFRQGAHVAEENLRRKKAHRCFQNEIDVAPARDNASSMSQIMWLSLPMTPEVLDKRGRRPGYVGTLCSFWMGTLVPLQRTCHSTTASQVDELTRGLALHQSPATKIRGTVLLSSLGFFMPEETNKSASVLPRCAPPDTRSGTRTVALANKLEKSDAFCISRSLGPI